MQISDLRKEYELLDIFCGLAEIPSPSLHEEGVIEYVENFCKQHDISYKLDDDEIITTWADRICQLTGMENKLEL